MFHHYRLNQIVVIPTQEENILDLFSTNTHTLISSTEVIPAISDHDLVYIDTSLKAKTSNGPKKKIFSSCHGDCDGLRNEIKTLADDLDVMDHDDVDGVWRALKLHLSYVIDKFVLQNGYLTTHTIPL